MVDGILSRPVAHLCVPIRCCLLALQAGMYAPYLDRLTKLGFLASGLHQAVFTLTSSLPCAVGQVQDVGLVFLAAMVQIYPSLPL